MENLEPRTSLIVNESLEFLENGAYEFQIPGVSIPPGRRWYQRTDGSQFALMNMNQDPQIVCRFDVERVDTFIPKLPTAMKIHVWEDTEGKPRCPSGVQISFLKWVLRTQCIEVSARDDLDYWQAMAGQLKNCGAILLLFNRQAKPHLREIDCPQQFREAIECCPYTCAGIIGNLEQVEVALC
ncbi:hypothetical protein H0K60_004480 [Salmonella enterica]|nr:hypothetical protein [Salmonella enterica]EFR2649723.1 hypothetical protein [Salmonella enterica]EFS1408072.1 hypothetical protein [Salmonella enterica]EHQ8162520.1 hypothetical protein [Salmonella enterica]EJZ9218173.1 hypothetical protein [Salmonella enterica]